MIGLNIDSGCHINKPQVDKMLVVVQVAGHLSAGKGIQASKDIPIPSLEEKWVRRQVHGNQTNKRDKKL